MAQAQGGQRPYLGNPPELPSIPGIDEKLADYLRRFSLWAQGNFNSTLQKRSSTGELFIHSPGGKPFSLGVNDSGQLTTTPLIPGSGGPAAAAMTFAPITNTGMAQPPNPAGTNSASYVMMGIGMSTLAATSVATRIWTLVVGNMGQTQPGAECDVVLCYGTGMPPANGAPQTGTIAGRPARFIAQTAGAFVPFTLIAVVNVTQNVPYWFDIAVRAVGGGAAIVADLDFTGIGLP